MILRDNIEIDAIGRYHRSKTGYIDGATESSVFKLAFEQAYKNSPTTWVVDKLSETKDALMGYQQELVSVEEAKDKWNLKIAQPETESKVRHLARLNAFNQYSENAQRIAKQSSGTSFYWTQTIGGIIAGSLFDPVLLVSTLGVGQGVKALSSSYKVVAKALHNSNPVIKYGSRFGILGGAEAAINVASGVAIAKNRGYDYTGKDAAIDTAIGSILGTFLSSWMIGNVRKKLGEGTKKTPFFTKKAYDTGTPLAITYKEKLVDTVKIEHPNLKPTKVIPPKSNTPRPRLNKISKESVKLDFEFISGIKGLTPLEIESARVIDFYDKVLGSVDVNALNEAERNVLTFVKANQLNGAVSHEYLHEFMNLQDNFNGLLKKVYEFVPVEGSRSEKAFYPLIEKEIASLIDHIANNPSIPQTTAGLNDYLVPFYANLSEARNIFSGRALTDNTIIPKVITPQSYTSTVKKGLDIIDKIKPYKVDTSIIKEGIKKITEPAYIKQLKSSDKIVKESVNKAKVTMNEDENNLNKVMRGSPASTREVVLDSMIEMLIIKKIKIGGDRKVIVDALTKYNYSLEDYYDKYTRLSTV